MSIMGGNEADRKESDMFNLFGKKSEAVVDKPSISSEIQSLADYMISNYKDVKCSYDATRDYDGSVLQSVSKGVIIINGTTTGFKIEKGMSKGCHVIGMENIKINRDEVLLIVKTLMTIRSKQKKDDDMNARKELAVLLGE